MYTVYKYVYVYIYIYSHPGVDRIADIFKKDFQKKINSWNIFETLSFYTFFVFVKSFLASFGTRVWRNFEKYKNQTTPKNR